MMEHAKKREREAIMMEQYGQFAGNSKKRRVTKPNDKSRFSADWDNSEDTTRIDPLYQEAQLLFGSGYRGGVDRILQKNESRLRKKNTANLYDSCDKHWAQKVLDEMTERDWRIFKEDFNISYKGSRAPKPIRSWAESNLSPELLKAVARSGFKTPSPIQMAAIPLGLQKRDLIGIAETGSGKTAAFVLPLLTFISELPPSADDEKEPQGPFAVILAPTRELAQQIEEQILKLSSFMKPIIKVTSIVGGQSIQKQGFKMEQGCDVIIIATPGRLIDCLERRYVSLNQCNFVVLDEADRMIDLGFEGQVISVLDSINDPRTTFMFSATMVPSVERLAKKLLKNPVVVTVGKTTESITQNVVMMKESDKIPKLQNLIREIGDKKTVIVFVNTRKTADFVAKNLDKTGINVVTFHGGKSQDQREISLAGFRSRRYNVLVATDVAARGIDVADVAHVVNYDMCASIETYMHRIGRTGRAGKIGEATTFLTVADSDVFNDLKEMLIRSKCRVPVELARDEASRFKPKMW